MSWPTAPLGDVAPAKPLWSVNISNEEKVLQITLDHIESDTGQLLKHNYASANEAGGSTHWFDGRHVLYSKLRPYLNKVYLPNEIGIGTTELVPMLPNDKVLDRKFLAYYLRSKSFVDWISHQIAGAKMPRVSMDVFWSHEIPLPPLAEQKRIAAILDKAEAIRRKRQQAIQLADELLRSVFLDMFGDPNSNSKNAPVLPMTKVFDIKTGSLNSNAAIVGGCYPFFTCAKEVFAIDDYAFDQEALLLAGNNAQADYDVKHYKGKFNAYQRTYVLTLRNASWSYPFYKFALEYQLSNLKRVSKGSNTKYITMEIMSRTMLPVPSESQQKSFVQYFDKVRNIRRSSESHVYESGNLFSSLSQKAFSGQL